MNQPTNLDQLLEHWRQDPDFTSTVFAWQTQPQRAALEFAFPAELPNALGASLHKRGIDFLYKHQIESFSSLNSGRNIVVTTGTSSGKTLCYQLPILSEYLHNPDMTALCLFPTKALAQDQFTSLSSLLFAVSEQTSLENAVALYDGDTPVNRRAGIRQNVHFMLSNPDMLHMAVLPHHTLWERFFRNLKFVVIDEAHTYRGIFGAHFANLIRRLKRICSFYGSAPQFVLTSATISNPVEHAEVLIEEVVELIAEDGSPKSARHFIVVNPPIIHQETGLRRSASAEAIRIAGDLAAYDVQTLLFTKTRRGVELLLRGLRESLPASETSVHGYRSGYLPGQRREIESGLRNGKIRMVAATNALELGIDIGGMDAVVIVGYPGSIAATRQQTGRAGRRLGPAAAILVASANPIDQYLVKHPDYLFERAPEKALTNPNNLLILLQQIRCSAFELPFKEKDTFGNLPMEDLISFLNYLEANEVLHSSRGSYFWASDQYPADTVSLRTTSGEVISLQVEGLQHPVTIGVVDEVSAYWMVHPGAIYLHEGDAYEVEELDLEKHRATLKPSHVDYFTLPKSNINIEKVEELNHLDEDSCSYSYGELLVTSQVASYKRIRWGTNENLGEFPLDMPQTRLETTGCWITIHSEVIDSLRLDGFWKNDPNQYGPNWEKQKYLARKRDQFKCQVCGLVETGMAHPVHHITPFRSFPSYEQANKLENLITLCPTCHHKAEQNVKMRSGLAGLSFALHEMAPLFLMCDVEDIGVSFDPKSALGDGQPVIVFYDQVPAGIGLSEELFKNPTLLLKKALELISTCTCQEGCPSCVGPAGENGIGGKEETLALLKAILKV